MKASNLDPIELFGTSNFKSSGIRRSIGLDYFTDEMKQTLEKNLIPISFLFGLYTSQIFAQEFPASTFTTDTLLIT